MARPQWWHDLSNIAMARPSLGIMRWLKDQVATILLHGKWVFHSNEGSISKFSYRTVRVYWEGADYLLTSLWKTSLQCTKPLHKRITADRARHSCLYTELTPDLPVGAMAEVFWHTLPSHCCASGQPRKMAVTRRLNDLQMKRFFTRRNQIQSL